jgi:nicotinate-nucleotide adenylyltransferase
MNNKTIKIGILGGSFNPPHSGHVHISNLAIKNLKLHQVWWVPTLQNPLKSGDISNNYFQRIDLCKKLTAQNNRIKIKDFEHKFFKYSKNFYTYKLVKRLRQIYPSYEFYLIVGSDNLENFHRWYRVKELSKLVKLIVFNRGSNKYKALKSRAGQQKLYLNFINCKKVNISSTEIRNKST